MVAETGGSLVKIMASAKYSNVVHVDSDRAATLADIKSFLFEELDWALIHLDGLPDAYLVQERVPMRFEYRVFVVDGVPVTGAGCVDVHTPDDNTGVAFDPVMQTSSADRTLVVDPVRAEEYRRFVDQVASEVQVEEPGLIMYVCDVATGPDGPLVVEFNDLWNSGLYATDPSLVVAAMLRDCDSLSRLG
jgi:hypothetical protein